MIIKTLIFERVVVMVSLHPEIQVRYQFCREKSPLDDAINSLI